MLIKVYNYFRLLKSKLNFKVSGVKVARGTWLHPKTKIGKYTRINSASHIGECQIGSYCAIAGRLVVRSSNHHTCYLNIQDWAQKKIVGSDVAVAGLRKGKVTIGNGVWIGDGVTILPGVTIGEGAVLGAGSIVTKSIPPYSIAVGNPAKVIKFRFSEPIIELILNLGWFEWNLAKIRKNKILFETNFEDIGLEEAKKILTDINS